MKTRTCKFLWSIFFVNTNKELIIRKSHLCSWKLFPFGGNPNSRTLREFLHYWYKYSHDFGNYCAVELLTCLIKHFCRFDANFTWNSIKSFNRWSSGKMSCLAHKTLRSISQMYERTSPNFTICPSIIPIRCNIDN